MVKMTFSPKLGSALLKVHMAHPSHKLFPIYERMFENSIQDGQGYHIEGWAQDYSNSNIFLKPLFRGNLDPFVNNANLGAIAHTSNGT